MIEGAFRVRTNKLSGHEKRPIKQKGRAMATSALGRKRAAPSIRVVGHSLATCNDPSAASRRHDIERDAR